MTRRLVAASAAALAGIVLIGLGQGAIASWFRAIGGGAAIGFAIAVFIESAPKRARTPESLRKIAERFGRLSIAVIVVCAVAGGVVNAVARKQAADEADATARDRAAVARAHADVVDRPCRRGSGPAVRGARLRGQALRSMLRGATPPTLDGPSHGREPRGDSGPASGEWPMNVTGLVCSSYALVPTTT